jgi:uncharacterized LabA/DUF88 family protein
MSNAALFVDLPNFYSRLLSSGIEDPRTLRDYFLDWFDFDRLANKLTGYHPSVWVYYSGRRFGPKDNRIEDVNLDNFIKRSNSQIGVTAKDVNIPGQQREPASYKCEECGHDGLAQWESEKGIDSSLTVQLFDTLEAWDEAYLLSGDADFVPTVESLRRTGKIVIGAGFTDASSALVRECYDYIFLSDIFFKDDIAAFQVFKNGGIVHNWMFDEIKPMSDTDYSSETVELSVEWQFIKGAMTVPNLSSLTINDILSSGPIFRVYLIIRGQIDLESRLAITSSFQQKFPKNIAFIDVNKGQILLVVSPMAWEGVKRRLELITSKFLGAKGYGALEHGQGFTFSYIYDTSSGKFVLSPNPG